MKSLHYFVLLITLSISSSAWLQAAEQDNWYLAKEWQVDDYVRGMHWDYNETTQSGLLFCATNNGIRAYDLNGSLVHSFGGSEYYDVVVDADGVVYATHSNGVTAFTQGPGRVTSVSVDHPGSRYNRYSSTNDIYKEDDNGNWYYPAHLYFEGTGSGAKAYVLMEKNESLSDDYNWYATGVVVEDGGSGYTGEVNASILTNGGSSYKSIQFNSDAPVYDPTADYAEGDVVRGHYSTSYSAYNFLYELTANDISKINNDWNESASYVEGDIVRILDGGSAAWYRRTNVVDEIDPDYNENPGVSSTQWEGIGLDNIDSLAQTGYFDLVDVTQSQGFDHASFTVTIGNGYSQSWNLDGMNNVSDITFHPQSGKLLVLDHNEYKIRYVDRNGTILSKEFGSYGDAPGQFQNGIYNIGVLPDSRIVVSDYHRLHWFDENGTFIKRSGSSWPYPRFEFAVSPTGNLLANHEWGWLMLTNSDGSILTDTFQISGVYISDSTQRTFVGNSSFAIADQDSDVRSIKVFQPAYRTKGLPTPNKLPEPAIRSVTQRPGTNIIDIVFEILDSDDENATVGILAAVDGNFDYPQNWITPTTLVDGSDVRIGGPIATNQEHNISWDIGQDWAEPTGNLKFKIICQDARRSSPVDIHFLELPLEDGNLTISRSPILNDDIRSYYRFLLGTRNIELSIDDSGNVVDLVGSVLLTPSGESTHQGREMFINSTGHRWASFIEVGSAREGSTAGTIESREARNPIFPRNLPRQVNEYGFDVGYYGSNAWWVVSNSTFPYYAFERIDLEHNGSSYDYFGEKVAISHPYTVVGDNSDNSDKRLHFYSDEQSMIHLVDPILLEPSDKAESSSDGFGSSFAITGDWLVVGASDADVHLRDEFGNVEQWRYNTGSVYLFDLSSGTPVEKGRFDCNQSDSYLGGSIDTYAEFVIVGAQYQRQNDDGWSHGGAYLLKIEPDGNFTELAHLVADDAEGGDYFGREVAIGENLIAISAPHARVITPNGETRDDGGKVYIFAYDESGAFELVQTLQSDSNDWYNSFGGTIDLEGSTLAVRTKDDYWNSKVNIYNFTEQLEFEFTTDIDFSNDDTFRRRFGQDIALDAGNLAISGEDYVLYYTSNNSGDFKLAHIFQPDQSVSGSGFGKSISLSGDDLAVGLPNFDRTIDSQYRYDVGKVIIYTREQ